GDDQPAAAPSPRPGRAVRESAPATVQAPDGGRVGQLLPQLYLHGLALGDFDLAPRGLLGDGAPLSAASIARLKAGWQAEYELWRTRCLADLEPGSCGSTGSTSRRGSRRTRPPSSWSSPACGTGGRSPSMCTSRRPGPREE